MDEDVFNLEIRKFLKKVGINSQREIEEAVRSALRAGTLGGDERLKAVMRLEIQSLGLDLRIEETIALDR